MHVHHQRLGRVMQVLVREASAGVAQTTRAKQEEGVEPPQQRGPNRRRPCPSGSYATGRSGWGWPPTRTPAGG